MLLRNHYFYFVLRIGTNKNISTHLPCSGMTPKGQTVQGERVLLKQGKWRVFPFNIAQAWLGSTGLDNTDLQFTDNPGIDPSAIVTDHHISSITKNAHLDQAPNNITYQKQPSMATVLPQTITAVPEGGTMTLGSKCPLITAVNSVSPASQAATKNKMSQCRDTTTGTISEPSMAQSVDELKLPPCLNIRESDYVDQNAP